MNTTSRRVTSATRVHHATNLEAAGEDELLDNETIDEEAYKMKRPSRLTQNSLFQLDAIVEN